MGSVTPLNECRGWSGGVGDMGSVTSHVDAVKGGLVVIVCAYS